ncbi:hypothetical protein Tsubulata_044144, partial [Turnera subulata]
FSCAESKPKLNNKVGCVIDYQIVKPYIRTSQKERRINKPNAAAAAAAAQTLDCLGSSKDSMLSIVRRRIKPVTIRMMPAASIHASPDDDHDDLVLGRKRPNSVLPPLKSPLEYEGNLEDGIALYRYMFPPTWSLDNEGFEVSSYGWTAETIQPAHEVVGGTADDYTAGIRPPFDDLTGCDLDCPKWRVRLSFIRAVQYLTQITGHKHEPVEIVRKKQVAFANAQEVALPPKPKPGAKSKRSCGRSKAVQDHLKATMHDNRTRVLRVDAAKCQDQLECQQVLDAGSMTHKNEKFSKFAIVGDAADLVKEDKMTQAIKKVLAENFQDVQETQPQMLLYNNLWLEAEASLCLLNSTARFDRMKMEIENYNLPKENGIFFFLKKPSSIKSCPFLFCLNSFFGFRHLSRFTRKVIYKLWRISQGPRIDEVVNKNGPLMYSSILDSSLSATSGHSDDVMAKFNILNSRIFRINRTG